MAGTDWQKNRIMWNFWTRAHSFVRFVDLLILKFLSNHLSVAYSLRKRVLKPIQNVIDCGFFYLNCQELPKFLQNVGQMFFHFQLYLKKFFRKQIPHFCFVSDNALIYVSMGRRNLVFVENALKPFVLCDHLRHNVFKAI